ncbi:anaerobic carbon-monoxide dehydrogenase catalytic subunit [Desulfurobacterium thermolithotrophum]|uniref:anaerobic carbon-monoxide dehydrogenase catalytic subunit n=1 Tax=Desulfurobacterium thermolithotrophum TaxID=64160 RepID=UPI0013CFEE83|nr:anaerobic carbon-monoxide dehydrogenase catalytic subunit [Desulfurobacterium thermolithotrophum]
MLKGWKPEDKSIDKATQEMIRKAEKEGIETIWDRLKAQLPQCGYGQLGVCCRICMQGPCRIDPFGNGPQKGVCGATAETIVARNLVRAIAAGAAGHSDHGRHVVLALKETLEHGAPYPIKDEKKLKDVAKKLGVPVEGRKAEEIAKDLVEIALGDFSKQDEEIIKFADAYANEKRKEVWKKTGVAPRNIDREIVEAMHRTTMGVDHDPLSLVAHGIKTSIADGWGGSLIATEFQDILFGTPKIGKGEANLGVLKEDYVNIVIHGHEPVLSEKIIEAAQDPELIELAKKYGAKGINAVGMCCTGLELLMRHGTPIAGNYLQQELAIVTGAVEAMVVDVQCIMPSLVDVARCFHTKIIDTSSLATFPGAVHVKFDEMRADEIAREIVRIAVENFPNRNKDKVQIPKGKSEAIGGFSVEAILEALGGTLKPLEEAIISGKIRGVVGIVGCNNAKIRHNHNHIVLTDELIKNDILIIGTGCWATACAEHGIFLPEYAEKAGEGLKSVCKALGIPPALNMGSCVDCSRMLVLADLMARDLGVDISDLPLAGSAPEAMTEKAVCIGTYFVASGILTHLGIVPPTVGSVEVTKLLTKDAMNIVGGAFYVEPDPIKAAKTLIDHIESKRKALGI